MLLIIFSEAGDLGLPTQLLYKPTVKIFCCRQFRTKSQQFLTELNAGYSRYSRFNTLWDALCVTCEVQLNEIK